MRNGPRFIRDTMNVADIRTGQNMGEWGQHTVAVNSDGSPKTFNTVGVKTLAGKVPS